MLWRKLRWIKYARAVKKKKRAPAVHSLIVYLNSGYRIYLNCFLQFNLWAIERLTFYNRFRRECHKDCIWVLKSLYAYWWAANVSLASIIISVKSNWIILKMVSKDKWPFSHHFPLYRRSILRGYITIYFI